MNTIKIKWLGHSCYSVTSNDYTIVLDPYAPNSVPGLTPLEVSANRVLCSHKHGDHGCEEAVTLIENETSPFNILKIDTWHDDANGTLRGANRIHILEAHGMRIVHLGDLGCELTSQQLDQLRNIDVLMIPVGGFYTINGKMARKVAEKLQPRVTLPMHYKTKYNAEWPISGPEEFLEGEPEEDIRREIEILRITNRDLSCQPRFALFKA